MAKRTNTNLTNARVNKNDEFYTQMSDIEEEVRHYKDQLAGKTVICNCDDPYESNFVKYFILNFRELGLKKLIATCYDGSPISATEFGPYALFGEDTTATPKISTAKQVKTLVSKAYKIEITEVKDFNNDGAIDLDDAKILLTQPGVVTLLDGNGDFQSDECLALLDESDICVTNPPFSKLKEFITTMIQHNKKFLILANMNTFKAKELFPLFKQGSFWAGYKFNFQTIFQTPYKNVSADNREFVLKNGYDPEEGYTKVPGLAWFTNLDVASRHEELVLFKNYSPEEHLPFDTYPKAINVDKVAEIPCDYFGQIGVPETFVGKHDPDQFVLLGILNGGRIPDLDFAVPYVEGKKKFTRLIIKRKYKDDGTLNTEENN